MWPKPWDVDENGQPLPPEQKLTMVQGKVRLVAEIEITEKMRQAGVQAYLDCDLECDSSSEIVESVFRAMVAAAVPTRSG